MMWKAYRGNKLQLGGTEGINHFAMANKELEKNVMALKKLSFI
jgi:hypothetical protein